MDYLSIICQYLTIKDIVTTKISNIEIYNIIESNYIWKKITERDFHREYIESIKLLEITNKNFSCELINKIDYKKLYRESYKEKKLLETFRYKNFPDSMDKNTIENFIDIFKEKIILIDYGFDEAYCLYSHLEDVDAIYELYFSEYKYKDKIKAIYINNDCLTDIPSSISNFTNLKRLIISGTRLFNLNNINLLPDSLEYLWIKGGNIPFNKICNQLSHLKNLIYLDIDDMNYTFDIDNDYISDVYDQYSIDTDELQGEELKLSIDYLFDKKQVLPFIPSLRNIKLESDECEKINLYVLKSFFNDFLKNYPDHDIIAYGYFTTDSDKINITSDLIQNELEEKKYYSENKYHIFDITIYNTSI